MMAGWAAAEVRRGALRFARRRDAPVVDRGRDIPGSPTCRDQPVNACPQALEQKAVCRPCRRRVRSLNSLTLLA